MEYLKIVEHLVIFKFNENANNSNKINMVNSLNALKNEISEIKRLAAVPFLQERSQGLALD